MDFSAVTQRLTTLVLGPVAEVTCRMVGVAAAEKASELLRQRFTDQSKALTRALAASRKRAWRTVEIGLAGDSFWGRCKDLLRPGEDVAFRDQIRAFVERLGQLDPSGDPERFRKAALTELRKARKDGLLDAAADPAQLADEVGLFARFGDGHELLRREREAVASMADEVNLLGYERLALLLSPPENSSDPGLLVTAARYYFRREVERDDELFRGLSYSRQEAMAEVQEQGFATLERLFGEQSDRVEAALSELETVVKQTHTAVLDLHEELSHQGQQNRELYESVMEVQRKLDMMRADVRPQDSVSIRTDAERQLVKEIVRKYRNLPDGDKSELPALLNAIGQLELASGSFQAAERDFSKVAGMVGPKSAKAEAHMNAYKAALEARQWAPAIKELIEAVKLDHRRFAPFPVGKFIPNRILGAGGFGVAFLCKHKYMAAPVVVKTLFEDQIERQIDEIFVEARMLARLAHPNIVRTQDCGYTDPQSKARPFVVMDYFDGISLEQHVQQHGPLKPEDWAPIGKQMAEALKAAHDADVLHRDVKPANLLVRREEWGMRAMLIDFGLALPAKVMRSSVSRRNQSLAGASIVGTIDYAAPEQLGKIPDVPVGPYSDVYGFAKTACYALFQTTQPVLSHWQSIPAPLAELLSWCLSERPEERPRDFGEILQFFEQLDRQEEPLELELISEGPAPAAAATPARKSRSGHAGATKPSDLFGDTPSRPRRRRFAEDEYDDDHYPPPVKSGKLITPTRAAIVGGVLAVLLVGIVAAVIFWPGDDKKGSGTNVAGTSGTDRPEGNSSQTTRRPGDTGTTPTPPRPGGTPPVTPRAGSGRPFGVINDGRIYLSDLQSPITIRGGFNPGGYLDSAENTRISVDGRVATKGLGRDLGVQRGHFSNEYRFDKPISRFVAHVAVNDTAGTGPAGGVVFGAYDGSKPSNWATGWKSPPLEDTGVLFPVDIKFDPPIDQLVIWAEVSSLGSARSPSDARNHVIWVDPAVFPVGVSPGDSSGGTPMPPDLALGKGRTYLADVAGTVTLEGTWPFRSDGRQGPSNDAQGKPIVVGGNPGPKSLSMCPNSNGTMVVKYNLGGKVTAMTGAAAIADTSGGAWSEVTFRVLGDGKELWSTVRKESGKLAAYAVDLRDVDEMELHVQAAGSNHDAHAVWFDPILHRIDDGPLPKPPLPADAPPADVPWKGNKAYVTDMKAFDITSGGKGELGTDGKLLDGTQIINNKNPSFKGLFIPPKDGLNELSYHIGEQASTFTTYVGFNDTHNDFFGQEVTFEVLGDGKSLWKSQPLKKKEATEVCRVSVAGVRVLTLRMDVSKSFVCVPVWLDPTLERGSAESSAGEWALGEPRAVDDLTVRPLGGDASGLLPVLANSPDGEAFYTVGGDGTVRRIAWDGFREQTRVSLTYPAKSAAVSELGLLVLVERPAPWLVLLDPNNLKTIRGGPLVEGVAISSGPKLRYAVAECRRNSDPEKPRLLIIDLVKFDIIGEVTSADLLLGNPGRGTDRFGFHITPDGKHVMGRTNLGEIQRWGIVTARVKGKLKATLRFEQTTPPVALGSQGELVFDPMTNRLALLHPEGNQADVPGYPVPEPYSTFVFDAGDLTKPAFRVIQGKSPTMIGFAKDAVYSNNGQSELIHFAADGKKEKEYRLDAADPRQFLAGPDGKSVLLTDDKLLGIEAEEVN